MKQLEFSGTVFSGKGEGKKFIRLPWVKRQIEEKLGFSPYEGTLNIRLTKESATLKEPLENAASMKICPALGYCTGLLFRAQINELECGVVVPEVANYPKEVLEVIAAVSLREALKLVDGQQIMITVILQ